MQETQTLQNVLVSSKISFNCHKLGRGRKTEKGKSSAVKKTVGEESVDVFCMFGDKKYANPPIEDWIVVTTGAIGPALNWR